MNLNEFHKIIPLIIISPVRDESALIEKTLKSIIDQTVWPLEWVIVDDGSTDNTAEIVKSYAKNYKFINLISNENRGFRKLGGGVISAFKFGLSQAIHKEYEFLAKLDGDMSFGPKYLEIMFSTLDSTPRLAAVSGKVFRPENGKFVPEWIIDEHVAGQFKLAEISRRYGAKHPSLIQAEMELSEAQRALIEAKEISIELSRKEFRFKELEREVQTNRNLYDTFFTRIKQANDSLELDTANARVIDPAVVPSLPFKPRKSLLVALALVMSLVFGAVLAFFLDYLDSTFKGAEDIEDKLGLSMLGMVPLVKKKKKDDSPIYFLDSNQNGYAEAMRTVRTSVVLSGIDKPHKVIMLTSSVPSEGKSTSAINLAVALGQMDKVLLIDGDMRKPTIAKVLNLPPNSPGLSNVVAATSTLDDCILHMEDANIDVLTAGLVPPNPLELLSSQKFAELIRSLSEKYDRIIIDSPPTLLVSDSLIMSKVSHAVLYVIRSDTTAYNTARTGVNRLLAAKAPVIGVILNKVNMKKAARYYGTYSGYYAYGDYVYGHAKNKKGD